MFTVECQTGCDSVTIINLQKEVAILKSALTRPEFCVDSILKDNDKLTRFYTGMPTYESFMAFVDYLQPKALKLTPWNGTHTKEAVVDENICNTFTTQIKGKCHCINVILHWLRNVNEI